MGSWLLFLLISSQLVAQGCVVDATFDIGLRWLRGEGSLFSIVVNATETPTTKTVPQSTLQDVANATNTEDPLHGRRTELVRDIPAVAVTETVHEQSAVSKTTEVVDLRDASTERSWTDAETADWTTLGTEEPTLSADPWLVNATTVSLDQLALVIGKVPDPVLHVVDNGDSSPPSFVVVSGRLGGTTTPIAVDTTGPTTAAPSTTTTTAVLHTTTAAAPNATSPYQILLDYLRPFIFGRFSAGATEATTVPATHPPKTDLSTEATRPFPVTTTTSVNGWQSSHLTTATTVAEGANETDASPAVATTHTASMTPVLTSGATTDATAIATLFPAEFRVTVDQRQNSVMGIAGQGDFNATVVSTGLPSTRPLPTPVEILTTSTPSEMSMYAPTTPLRVNAETPVSTSGPTDIPVHTSVIVKAITTYRPIARGGDRHSTIPQPVQSLTETPTASFPAIFDLYGPSVDPGSQTAPSDFASSEVSPSQQDDSAAQGLVYRHYYDPSQLMQTF